MSAELSLLEEKIGYSFVNKALLVRAFTHSTYAEKTGCESNERMEYLGDAVLELVVSKKQYVSGIKAEVISTSRGTLAERSNIFLPSAFLFFTHLQPFLLHIISPSGKRKSENRTPAATTTAYVIQRSDELKVSTTRQKTAK